MFFSGLQTAAVGCSIPELVQLIDLPPYFVEPQARHLSFERSDSTFQLIAVLPSLSPLTAISKQEQDRERDQ